MAKAPDTESNAAAAGGEELVCAECGAAMGPDELICPQCGAEFGYYCPQCDQEVPPDATVCPHCGAELEEGVIVTVLPDAGYKYLSERFWGR